MIAQGGADPPRFSWVRSTGARIFSNGALMLPVTGSVPGHTTAEGGGP